MFFANLAGPIALIVVTAFMFLLVPRERIRMLFPVGLIFGAVLGVATYHILQNIVQAWHFQQADLIAPAGIPLFLTLAWVPYSIIYFHMLAQYRSSAHLVLLILSSAAVPTFFQFLLKINGMVAANWPWWGNFFYALVVYNGLGLLIFYKIKSPLTPL